MRCQVRIDGGLDALEEVGMLILIAAEVVAAVRDVAANAVPRNAVDGVLVTGSLPTRSGRVDGADLCLEEGLAAALNREKTCPQLMADTCRRRARGSPGGLR
ncbi:MULTISPECIES: hypothetical protein [Halolamina]|uniref:hypothetical protein n=1 Tax=Halolamina TaxID=1075397 RepID=UPI00116071E3|nr:MULTISPECIES: hypothetical protein [Halolamina]NHX36506.1 hypothetical protein [Halolamina sp. R1-12]